MAVVDPRSAVLVTPAGRLKTIGVIVGCVGLLLGLTSIFVETRSRHRTAGWLRFFGVVALVVASVLIASSE